MWRKSARMTQNSADRSDVGARCLCCYPRWEMRRDCLRKFDECKLMQLPPSVQSRTVSSPRRIKGTQSVGQQLVRTLLYSRARVVPIQRNTQRPIIPRPSLYFSLSTLALAKLHDECQVPVSSSPFFYCQLLPLMDICPTSPKKHQKVLIPANVRMLSLCPPLLSIKRNLS